MKLFSLKPTRQEFADSDVICDLDKLIAEPIAFKFQGKIHEIKPISTEEFFRVSNALVRLDTLREQKGTTDANTLIDAYGELIASVCSTMNRNDISKMTQAQVGALFQLVLDCITGKAYTQKKNTVGMTPLTEGQLD